MAHAPRPDGESFVQVAAATQQHGERVVTRTLLQPGGAVVHVAAVVDGDERREPRRVRLGVQLQQCGVDLLEIRNSFLVSSAFCITRLLGYLGKNHLGVIFFFF